MTREEAIRILDHETTVEALAEIEYYNGFGGKTAAVQAVSDACALAVAALREQEERRWIPVTERRPEVETDVLVQYNRNGYKGITTAMYEDGNTYTEDSLWFWNEKSCFCTYDEEKDDYIIPEGWWESRYFNPDDVYNNVIDVPVTHWMPLPPAQEDMK